MLGVCRCAGATAPALSIWPLPPASTRQSSGLHPSSALTSPAPFSVSVSVFLLGMVWSFAAPAAGLSCSAQRPDASRSRSWVLGFLHSCMPSVPAIHWSTRRCCRMPMLMLMRGAPLVIYQERGVGGSEAQRRRRLGGSDGPSAKSHRLTFSPLCATPYQSRYHAFLVLGSFVFGWKVAGRCGAHSCTGTRVPNRSDWCPAYVIVPGCRTRKAVVIPENRSRIAVAEPVRTYSSSLDIFIFRILRSRVVCACGSGGKEGERLRYLRS